MRPSCSAPSLSTTKAYMPPQVCKFGRSSWLLFGNLQLKRCKEPAIEHEPIRLMHVT